MTETSAPKIVADKSLPGVGTLVPLVAATRSAKGTWILAAGPSSYHGEPVVLFTANGQKFSKVKLPDTGSAFNLRTILALDDKQLFVGGQCGLFSSNDGGKTWKEVKGVTGVWTLAEHDGRLWACGNAEIWRSDDKGKKWKKLAVPKGGDCFGLAVVSRDEAYIADDNRILRVQGDKISVVHKCPGVYVSKIARGADGTLVAAAHKGNIFTSKDGTTWTKAKVPSGRDYNAVVFHGGRFLVGGTKGMLLELTPGSPARTITTKLGEADDHVLGFAPMGEGVLVLGGRDMNSSMDRSGVALALGKMGGAAPAAEKPRALPSLVTRKRAVGKRHDLTKFERSTWKEAKARFKGLVTPEAAPTEVRVYPAMSVDALDLTAKGGQSLLVIVDGDLFVDGAMTVTSCEDDDTYVSVHVAGNLSAQSLALSLDPRLKVTGDIEVEDVVSCGQGRALIEVGGGIRCRFAIATAPGQISVKKGIEGMAIGDKACIKGAKELAPEEKAFDVLKKPFVDAESSTMKPHEVTKALRKGTRVTV